jgi:hypothetical protein
MVELRAMLHGPKTMRLSAGSTRVCDVQPPTVRLMLGLAVNVLEAETIGSMMSRMSGTRWQRRPSVAGPGHGGFSGELGRL